MGARPLLRPQKGLSQVHNAPWINPNGLCDGPHPKHDLWKLQYDNQNTGIRKFVKRNGSINYELVCLTSGCRFVSPPIPINVAKLLLWARLPVLEDRHSIKHGDVCSYKTCTSTEIEWHHFAPRNTFSDADNYPVMPLCRAHQRAWHLTMDGYQWRRVSA